MSILNKSRNFRYNIVSSFTNTPVYDFGIYARGYHLAAKNLAENLLAKGGFGDCEGYPVVFLYRHCLELHLKNIIYWSLRIAAFRNLNTKYKRFFNIHRLKKLSIIAIDLIETLFPKEIDKNILDSILQLSKDFDSIDNNSFSYRYPINQEGKPSTGKHQVVNIESIYEETERLLAELETMRFGLQGETEVLWEALDIQYFN